MKLFITTEVSWDTGLQKISHILPSDYSEKYFRKNYGNEIKEILISLVCLESNSFKQRKRFTKSDSVLCYDIMFDYKYIKSLEENKKWKFVANELITSVKIIESYRFKDFNSELFKNDLTQLCEDYFFAEAF